MQRADIVIGVLAVVAIAGSAVGVALYEPAALASWNVTVATETVEPSGLSVSDTLQGTGAKTVTLDITETNVTQAVFAVGLSGSAARAQALTVDVVATAPGNQSAVGTATLAAGPGATGSGTVTVVVGAVPTGGTFGAANETDALAIVGTNLNGTGTWTFEMRISGGGGGVGPVPGEQVTVTITVDRLTRYTAEASQSIPGGQAA